MINKIFICKEDIRNINAKKGDKLKVSDCVDLVKTKVYILNYNNSDQLNTRNTTIKEKYLKELIDKEKISEYKIVKTATFNKLKKAMETNKEVIIEYKVSKRLTNFFVCKVKKSESITGYVDTIDTKDNIRNRLFINKIVSVRGL